MSEKILFSRGNPSNGAVVPSSDLGVLVIDPNKVFDEYNVIKDRYIKQEDLVMYASLKVYKKRRTYVFYEPNQPAKIETASEGPIKVNFLNPIARKTSDNLDGIINKNNLTVDWADFFTSNSANNSESADFVLDPESFGITNIDIKVNASYLPIIEIKFTDVQGRVLFERGNDPNNPYNIFYTYPYPAYTLTYKGYYGKALEIPMVLLKSNTAFDPMTGNYNITAEFQSEVFALFSTLLTIYPYVAPYMFKLQNGNFLGGEILKMLYDRQNKEIKASVSSRKEFDNYNITSYPTLHDLSKALKKIPNKVTKGKINSTEKVSNTIKEKKNIIKASNDAILKIFSDGTKYRFDTSTNVYKPVNTTNAITSRDKPDEINQNLVRINDSVKEIANLQLPNKKNNTFFDDLKSDTKDNPYYKEPNGLKISKDKVFDTFVFRNDFTVLTDEYILENYQKIYSSILINIDNLERSIEEDYIEDQIKDMGLTLGYRPNLSNVLRIICNNIQTFLILLKLSARNANKQIKDNYKNRVTINSNTIDYKQEQSTSFYDAYPAFYKAFNEVIDGKVVNKQSLEYPGADPRNLEWFEIIFVEEIYKAIEEIKNRNKVTPSSGGSIKQEETGILTSFMLGNNNLDVYKNSDVNSVLFELIAKFNMYAPYSGFVSRNLANYSFTENIVNFEFKLLDRNILSKLGSNEKFLFITDIKNATSEENTGGTLYTNLGNFGIRHLGLGQKTQADALNILSSASDRFIKLVQGPFVRPTFESVVNDYKNAFSVSRKNLYNKINMESIEKNVNLFTIGSQKQRELNTLVDLKPNYSYKNTDSVSYGDYNSKLSNINLNLRSELLFQGFFLGKNNFISQVRISPDLGRGLAFAKTESAPSLTFNTKKSETPFKQVTSSGGTIHHTIFNNI